MTENDKIQAIMAGASLVCLYWAFKIASCDTTPHIDDDDDDDDDDDEDYDDDDDDDD